MVVFLEDCSRRRACLRFELTWLPIFRIQGCAATIAVAASSRNLELCYRSKSKFCPSFSIDKESLKVRTLRVQCVWRDGMGRTTQVANEDCGVVIDSVVRKVGVVLECAWYGEVKSD